MFQREVVELSRDTVPVIPFEHDAGKLPVDPQKQIARLRNGRFHCVGLGQIPHGFIVSRLDADPGQGHIRDQS